MNVVASADEALIEIQGTAERAVFSRSQMDRLMDLALAGIETLCTRQGEAVADLMASVEALAGKSRRQVPAKDEGSLWGPPE